MKRNAWIAITAGLALAGCQRGEVGGELRRGAGTSELASIAHRGPTFDVRGVVARVRASYRADGDGFAGGPAALGSRLSASGALRIEPLHFPPVKDAQTTPASRREHHHASALRGAPLTLETATIGRGGAASITGGTGGTGVTGINGQARAAKDGGVEIDRGVAMESFRALDDGIEQSWRFADRPRGGGDLELRVAIAGQDYRSATATGLHFVDPATGVGVRYGVATWIDAAGARTTLMPRYEDGAIAITVPAALVEASAYPAVLDPSVVGEFGIDTPVGGPPSNKELRPAVAFGAGKYLIAWVDDRNNNADFLDIFGARVNTNGNVLDPNGIPIATDTGVDSDAQVTFDGTSFVVAYTSFTGLGQGAFAVTVDPATGNVGAPSTVQGSGGVNFAHNPKLAGDGAGHSFYVNEFASGGGGFFFVEGKLLNGSTPAGSGGFSFSNPANQELPAVASDGNGYLVVWINSIAGAGNGLYGQLIDNTGSVSGSPFAIATGHGEFNPSITFGGGDYLVVWEDNSNVNRTDLLGIRIHSGGGFDGGVITVAQDLIGGFSAFEEVATFDGVNYDVSYLDQLNNTIKVMLQQVRTDGTLLGGPVLIKNAPSGPQSNGVAGGTGGNSLVVYYAFDNDVSVQNERVFATLFKNLPDGASCSGNQDCIHSNCVSGICCNNACGACGSCATGTCTPLVGGTTCRPAAGACDVLEACDGVAVTCPPDALQVAGFVCRPSTGACDVGEVCDGSSTACPVDVAVSQACATGCSGAAGCGFTDTDGDGFNDTWEANGYIDNNCNGKLDAGDTPLPNADPKKPNVYVKYDYLFTGGHSHQPTNKVLTDVQNAYAAQNVILTYYNVSDAIAEHQVVSLEAPGALPACVGGDGVSFYTIKNAHFPPELKGAWHYVLFAHLNTCDFGTNLDPSSLCSTCPASVKTGNAPPYGLTGVSELPGNDVIVSFGAYVDHGDAVTDNMVSGTFLHELGHNLGLHHGGFEDLIQKPNYMSVMNYTYQFGIGVAPMGTLCFSSTVDPTPNDNARRIDYSAKALRTLKEGGGGGGVCTDDGGGGLDESIGLDGNPLDVVHWYADFGSTDLFGLASACAINWDNIAPGNKVGVFADVSGDGACSTLVGYADWAHTNPGPGVTKMTNLQLGFQCNTGFWADGVSPASQRSDDELTLQYSLAHHMLLPFIPVQIDVRPGCSSNFITPGAAGVVPVVAYGSADFDPMQVDPATLRLAGAGALFVDATVDVDNNGFRDLQASFPMASMNVNAFSTSVTLNGALYSSQGFGGSDGITIVSGPGPVVTPTNDGSGYSRTIANALDHSFQSYTLADCVQSAVDRCGVALSPNSAGQILRITSDEIDGGDHGKSVHGGSDMQITGASSFGVRRERNGTGDGRVYTITYTITDGIGDATQAQCRIQVKHDTTGPNAVDSGVQACIGSGC